MLPHVQNIHGNIFPYTKYVFVYEKLFFLYKFIYKSLTLISLSWVYGMNCLPNSYGKHIFPIACAWQKARLAHVKAHGLTNDRVLLENTVLFSCVESASDVEKSGAARIADALGRAHSPGPVHSRCDPTAGGKSSGPRSARG